MSSNKVDFRSEPIALMAALPNEGELLLTQLQLRRIISGGGHKIYGGNFAGREVLVAFSGLGKINAAATAATILANFSVSRIWMWGSAGAYPLPDIEINDLALASAEILGDEGVVTITSWRSLEAIGIPLALAFGSQLLIGIVPALQYVLPWRLAVGGENGTLAVIEAVILGTVLFSWLPVVSVAGFTVLFTAVAIYQFRREEF